MIPSPRALVLRYQSPPLSRALNLTYIDFTKLLEERFLKASSDRRSEKTKQIGIYHRFYANSICIITCTLYLVKHLLTHTVDIGYSDNAGGIDFWSNYHYNYPILSNPPGIPGLPQDLTYNPGNQGFTRKSRSLHKFDNFDSG